MASDKHAVDVRLALTDFVFEVQRQDHDCVQIFQYQTAHADPALLEAYCYTSRISYEPGEILASHASATQADVQLTIIRDGAVLRKVADFSAVSVPSVPTPSDFYVHGCNWPVREAIDAWVEKGGNVARFAGNFGWQIRLEHGGNVQVCYKERALDADPCMHGAESHLTTALWEDPVTRRPGSLTFGLQSTQGIYARVGAAVARGSGGFTVYRPEHWAFADADLYYGDTFGSTARIFAFECDGLEYEFKQGLPYPRSSPAIPPGLEILAMNLVSPVETDHMLPMTRLFAGDVSLRGVARLRYGDESAEHLAAARRGSGMIVAFKKAAGEIFHAGTSEWVNGLRLRETFTETITRTVVRRLAGLSEPNA